MTTENLTEIEEMVEPNVEQTMEDILAMYALLSHKALHGYLTNGKPPVMRFGNILLAELGPIGVTKTQYKKGVEMNDYTKSHRQIMNDYKDTLVLGIHTNPDKTEEKAEWVVLCFSWRDPSPRISSNEEHRALTTEQFISTFSDKGGKVDAITLPGKSLRIAANSFTYMWDRIMQAETENSLTGSESEPTAEELVDVE